MNVFVKTVLMCTAVIAGVGLGTANADRAGMGMFAYGPDARFQQFLCAIDVTYVSGRVAERLAAELKLTDPQKASLGDLKDTFSKAATDAKAYCNDAPDMSTLVGRVGFMEKRTEGLLTLLKAVQPKLEAFSATLDDTQRKQFNHIELFGLFLRQAWNPAADDAGEDE